MLIYMYYENNFKKNYIQYFKKIKIQEYYCYHLSKTNWKNTPCSKILPKHINKKFEYILFDDPEERLRFKESGISILQNLKADIIVFDEIQKFQKFLNT